MVHETKYQTGSDGYHYGVNQGHINTITSNQADIATRISNLSNKLSAISDNIGALKEELNKIPGLNSEAEKIEIKLNSLLSLMNILNQETRSIDDKLKKASNNCVSEINEISNAIKAVKDESFVTNLKNLLEEIKSLNSTVNTQIKYCNESSDQINKALSSLNETISSLSEFLQSTETEFRKQTETLERLENSDNKRDISIKNYILFGLCAVSTIGAISYGFDLANEVGVEKRNSTKNLTLLGLCSSSSILTLCGMIRNLCKPSQKIDEVDLESGKKLLNVE
jgi:chromosome segregation ATPase